MTHPASAQLEAFLARSRWFGGKGRTFSVGEVRRVGRLNGDLTGVKEGPQVAIDIAEVVYDDGGVDLYQLPLAFYPAPEGRLEHALIGEWKDDEHGPSFVYDAVHDREAMAHWLAAFMAPPDPASSTLAFHRVPGDHELDPTTHSTLFSGEQSNSSVAFGEDSLMKVFRRVTPGVNPDVQIHDVLTRAGSDHVAALYGWLDTLWPPEGAADAVIQLAMLQQFLRTASDGFELAKASVRNLLGEEDLHPHEVGGDFFAESERLGVALAEIHGSLAESFGVSHKAAHEVGELARAMHGRLEAALPVVPDLDEYAPALRSAYDELAGLEQVEVQRIHGDLHLGQTLRTVKGWKFVDFEGEPAKTLAERLLPDSVWRDVAGMLRSFDYAPHVVERGFSEGDPEGARQRAYRAEEWATRNRRAFLDAYAGRELSEAELALLAAYEADKAVYEAVYETRNRPDWVSIPLAALARLAG